MLSLCALFYGDYADLSQRLLESWLPRLPAEAKLRDIRLGLNEVTAKNRRAIDACAGRLVQVTGRPVLFFDAPRNLCKYPLMRRMFYGRPLPPYVMWCDDDTYFTFPPDSSHLWWSRLWRRIATCDMVGRLYYMPVKGQQGEWIKSQPWFNPKLGLPPCRGRKWPLIRFANGAWWLAKSRILTNHDWPWPELKHNGGDSLLGEMLRHCGYVLENWGDGVAGNRAKRRGYREPRLGLTYDGSPPDLSHQAGEVYLTVWRHQ